MAVTCPYCRSIVEPRILANGQKLCPICNNSGHTAAPGQPMPMAGPRTADGAVASMVLGILSLVIPYVGWIMGIIAIVLGKQADRRIAQDPSLQGEGMAKAGRVMGLVSVIIYAAILAIIILVFVLLLAFGTEVSSNQTASSL